MDSLDLYYLIRIIDRIDILNPPRNQGKQCLCPANTCHSQTPICKELAIQTPLVIVAPVVIISVSLAVNLGRGFGEGLGKLYSPHVDMPGL